MTPCQRRKAVVLVPQAGGSTWIKMDQPFQALNSASFSWQRQSQGKCIIPGATGQKSQDRLTSQSHQHPTHQPTFEQFKLKRTRHVVLRTSGEAKPKRLPCKSRPDFLAAKWVQRIWRVCSCFFIEVWCWLLSKEPCSPCKARPSAWRVLVDVLWLLDPRRQRRHASWGFHILGIQTLKLMNLESRNQRHHMT